MQHPDEGTIHAWLDGEIATEESAALEAHISECQDCSAKVAEARGLIAASSRIVSALDIVPGGVIPAARPKRNAWYATTQFRAAAAVLIVAGASALVMRNSGKRAMEDAVSMSAPVAKETVAAPKPVSEPPALAAAPTQVSARDETRNTSQQAAAARQRIKPEAAPMAKISAPPSDASAERDLAAREAAANAIAGSAAGAAAAAPPPPMPVAALRRAMEPEFRKARMDSLGSNTYTVFKTRDSVEVTLIDAAPAQMQAQQAAPPKVLDAPASVTVTGAAASQAKSRAESQPQIFTLAWTDKRGHRMTLRGPVALTILEQIRSTLPPDQR